MDLLDPNITGTCQQSGDIENPNHTNKINTTEHIVEHAVAPGEDHEMVDFDITNQAEELELVDTRTRPQGNPRGALSDCPLLKDCPQEVLNLIYSYIVTYDEPITLEPEGRILKKHYDAHLKKCPFGAGSNTARQKFFSDPKKERHHHRVAKYGDRTRIIPNWSEEVCDSFCTNPFTGGTKLIEVKDSVLQYRLVCKKFNEALPFVFWQENRFFFTDAVNMHSSLTHLSNHAKTVQAAYPTSISAHGDMVRNIRKILIHFSPRRANLYKDVAEMLPALTSLHLLLYHNSTVLTFDKKLDAVNGFGKNPLSMAQHIETFCIAFSHTRSCKMIKEVVLSGTDLVKYWTINDDESFFEVRDINNPGAIGHVIQQNILIVEGPFMTAEDLKEEKELRKKRLAAEKAAEKLAEEKHKEEQKQAAADWAKAKSKRNKETKKLAEEFVDGKKVLVWLNPHIRRYEVIPADEAAQLCMKEFKNISARKNTNTQMKYTGGNSSCEREINQLRAQEMQLQAVQAQQHAQQHNRAGVKQAHGMHANFRPSSILGGPNLQRPNYGTINIFHQHGYSGVAAQAPVANGNGLANGTANQTGLAPFPQQLAGNYNGQGIPTATHAIMAQGPHLAPNSGNGFPMVNGNHGFMPAAPPTIVNQHGSSQAVGNHSIVGMARRPPTQTQPQNFANGRFNTQSQVSRYNAGNGND